jgi:hypothetical protein
LPAQHACKKPLCHASLRLGSLSIINRLIGHAHEEPADPDAVKIARRFRFRFRYSIYRAAALSPRALQLAAVFPALALAIFSDCYSSAFPYGATLDNFRRLESLRRDAMRLVDSGAPLKMIADLMCVPMAVRKIKPGAADLALSVINAFGDQRLIHAYMPFSLPKMTLWLRCIKISEDAGPEFIEWIAKHSLEIGRAPFEVINFLIDVKDWVRACHRASDPIHIFKANPFHNESRGEQFVVRPFNPGMSLKTVTRLSSDWHEAVANNMSGPCYEFPEPWLRDGTSCGYEIAPLVTAADLYREGHTMHHCVGSYADLARQGEAYFYSVRNGTESIATLELVRRGESVRLGQIRGPCNGEVPNVVIRAVKAWLRSQPEVRLTKLPHVDEDAFEIPF